MKRSSYIWVFLIMLMLPFIISCSFSVRLWQLIQEASKFMHAEENLVEMTAKGNIIGPGVGKEWGNGYTITTSEITLHWNVDDRDGTTLPKVWGEGIMVMYNEEGCSPGPNTISDSFTFTGSVTTDGLTYTGGVAVKASDTCSWQTTMPEYSALWKATRTGDLIEGEIDGKGIFRLVVQPLPED